ncbi:MAG: carboxypeptidase regulatory-like domain-containing protein [Pyrinomonadaceae bacterium]
MKKSFMFVFVFILSSSIFTKAQIMSGGNYALWQSVTANGGLQNSAGGNFAVDGTAGQSAAGQNMISSPYVYTQVGGFWVNFFPPTAASVTVRGRVMTPDGRGLMNARVVMTDSKGNSRTVMTTHFGYYRFEDVQVGELYIFRVESKRYEFMPQAVVVMEDIDNLDFVAMPRKY